MLYACKGAHSLRRSEREREKERERKRERDREEERERGRGRERKTKRGRERERKREERVREREREKERESEGERGRENMSEFLCLYLKGMTGALAPFSYLVFNNSQIIWQFYHYKKFDTIAVVQ